MSKYKKPLAANQVNISEQMLRLRNELSKQGYITSLSPNYVLDSQLVGADYLRHSPAASHLQDATAVIYTVGGNFTVSLFHHKRIEPMHVYLDSDLEWVGPANPEDSYIAHYSNLGQLLADHPPRGVLPLDQDKDEFLAGRGLGEETRQRFFNPEPLRSLAATMETSELETETATESEAVEA